MPYLIRVQGKVLATTNVRPDVIEIEHTTQMGAVLNTYTYKEVENEEEEEE